MRRLTALPVILILLLVFAIPANAATLDVGPGQAFATIQDAVDAASPGDTITIHAGIYQESVTISTNNITLKGESGTILDGTSIGPANAITLSGRVSGVTIQGLEIRNYESSSHAAYIITDGCAIQAWNNGTNNITIRDNHIHSNGMNSVLIGNEGEGLHTSWRIENNVINGRGIFLINTSNSHVKGNTITGGFYGVYLSARNTIPYSGTVNVKTVKITNNRLSGHAYAICLHPVAELQIDPYPPIPGAAASLVNVMVKNNIINNGQFGVGAWAHANHSEMVSNAKIIGNEFSNLIASGVSLSGEVINTLIANNTFTNCSTEINDAGQRTRIPPGRP